MMQNDGSRNGTSCLFSATDCKAHIADLKMFGFDYDEPVGMHKAKLTPAARRRLLTEGSVKALIGEVEFSTKAPEHATGGDLELRRSLTRGYNRNPEFTRLMSTHLFPLLPAPRICATGVIFGGW